MEIFKNQEEIYGEKVMRSVIRINISFKQINISKQCHIYKHKLNSRFLVSDLPTIEIP